MVKYSYIVGTYLIEHVMQRLKALSFIMTLGGYSNFHKSILWTMIVDSREYIISKP